MWGGAIIETTWGLGFCRPIGFWGCESNWVIRVGVLKTELFAHDRRKMNGGHQGLDIHQSSSEGPPTFNRVQVRVPSVCRQPAPNNVDP